MSQLPTPSLITELEVRQDEALQSLFELEQRIASAIAEFGGTSPNSAKPGKVDRVATSDTVEVPGPGALELKVYEPGEVEPAGEDSAAA